MTIIQAYELVFPLVGCSLKPDKPGIPVMENDVYGTAFSIGGGLFLTAGHSLRGAAGHKLIGVGVREGETWRLVVIDEHEIIDSHDIGVLRATIPEASVLPWATSELAMLTQVQTVGFPYAFDRDQMTIGIRAFGGNLVSSRTFLGFPARPRVYELPFACPRGLSGAPVFTADNTSRLVGLVAGNTATDMLLLRESAVTKEGETTVFEQYERLTLGIAVQTASLLSVQSRLVGQSLREHLESHGLLWPEPKKRL